MSVSTLARPEPSFEESKRIHAFWLEHQDEFLARYPEQFVAVKDGNVVAANPDLAMLFYELRDLGLNARTDVAIQLISSRAASLLL